MKVRVSFVWMALIVLMVTLGCAKDKNSPRETGLRDETYNATEAEAKERLNQLMREKISSEQQYEDSGSIPVIYRRPYYFREYSVYPDGPDGFQVEFRENDSRTNPLFAEVKVNKIRYSTQMYRKHNQAASDTNFLRDTGEEVFYFEWHNGRWQQTGAIFNAQTTEEMVDGAWVSHHQKTIRVNPGAERPGWIGRFWERIRGEK
ncbi:MAG TPA: hypothetical protein PLC40_14790 [Candidatus Hydrogenedentes bacterium]|nr:hypothetical protein [Candidatus Hydrogenedentota bacterium]